jgi:2-oxoisovalerate dehydrogenase E1 component alpha subunit
MDSDGVIVDKSRGPPEVSNEEAITWYKNMLTGSYHRRNWSYFGAYSLMTPVNIMDLIMFEAQRQGRLSFYMVRILWLPDSPILTLLDLE